MLPTWYLVPIVLSFAISGLCLQSKNHPPQVKILTPLQEGVYTTNSVVRYAISVSDQEDGESKYDEIPADRIFLEVRYAAGTEGAPILKDSHPKVPIGLTHMRKSDCFTCHQFKSRLIGPSFSDIAQRYDNTSAERQRLAECTINGSRDVWGKAIMPAHSDLSQETAEEMVQWILENGMDERADFLVGKEGSFRMRVPPDMSGGFFVLRATYIDNGLPGQPESSLSGNDVVIIRHK